MAESMIRLSARCGVGGGGETKNEEGIQFNFKESKAITETSDILCRSVSRTHNHLEAGSASETLCLFRLARWTVSRIPWQLVTLDELWSIYINNTVTAWVTSEVNTPPWWWQRIAETCSGKIWNVSMNHTATLTHLLVISKHRSWRSLKQPAAKSILHR
jgi:hypothetical protein